MSWLDRLLGKRRDARAEREKILQDKGRVERERRSILPRVQDREEWASFYSNALRTLEDRSIHPAARLLIMSEEDVLVNELLFELSQEPLDTAALSALDAQIKAKLNETVIKVNALKGGTVSVIAKQEQSAFFQRLKKARDDAELQNLSFDGIRGKLSDFALMKKRLSVLANPSIDVAGKLVWVESEEARRLSEGYFSLLNALAESYSMQNELELHKTEVAIEQIIANEVRASGAVVNAHEKNQGSPDSEMD